MKYAAEMGSDAMVYVHSFIKIGAGIRKLMGGGLHRHTESIVISQACILFFN
jgi:hypothetical protein